MDAKKTGAYLAALRRAGGLTQQETAERLDISNKTVSKWESGGGFPDITVLSALAELYGVTADEILAGESLPRTVAPEKKEAVTEQRKRLLAKLRTRFDVCWILALALAVVGGGVIKYVSKPALILSVAALWIGYVLLVNPLREVEGGEALYPNLCRKLLLAAVVQWGALLRFYPFYIPYSYYSEDMRPLLLALISLRWPIFILGTLLLWGLFQLLFTRLAGKGKSLLPIPARVIAPWLLWGALFFLVWRFVDSGYQTAAAPWIEKYPQWSFLEVGKWPVLKERFDAEVGPYLIARRLTLGAGIGAGALLAIGQLSLLWKKKLRKAAKNDTISPEETRDEEA